MVLDSDEGRFGGRGRLGHGVDHFTQPEGTPGMSLGILHELYRSQEAGLADAQVLSKSGVVLDKAPAVCTATLCDGCCGVEGGAEVAALPLTSPLCRNFCRPARDELQQPAALHASAGSGADCGRLCPRTRGVGNWILLIIRSHAQTCAGQPNTGQVLCAMKYAV